MFKQELMTPQAIEHEVEMLHELLFSVERLDNVVKAHEIIDLNKYKLISKHFEIKTVPRMGPAPANPNHTPCHHRGVRAGAPRARYRSRCGTPAIGNHNSQTK